MGFDTSAIFEKLRLADEDAPKSIKGDAAKYNAVKKAMANVGVDFDTMPTTFNYKNLVGTTERNGYSPTPENIKNTLYAKLFPESAENIIRNNNNGTC